MFSIKKTNFIIYTCIVLIGIITTMTSPLLIEFAKMSNTPLNKIGAIFTFNTIGYLFFSNLNGLIAQRFNQRKLLSSILIIYSISIFIISYSNSTFSLYIIMLFIGGGSGSLMSLLTAYINSLNISRSYYFVNKIHIYFGIGAILGPLLVSIFDFFLLNWKYIYMIIAIILFIVGILFLKVQYSNDSNKNTFEKLDLSTVKGFISNKYLIITAICIALYNGAEVGSWGWLSTNLKEQNMSNVKSNLAVSLFWISMTMGRGLITKSTNKYKIKNIISILLIFSVISNILINLNSNIFYSGFLIFLIGLSYSAICPLLISLGFEKFENSNQSYAISSILLSSGCIGIMIIPYLMGINIEVGIYIPMISLLICFIILNWGYSKKN